MECPLTTYHLPLSTFACLLTELPGGDARGVRRTSPPSASTTAKTTHRDFQRPPLAILAGASILKGEAGALLAARVGLPKKLELELGGVAPHSASGYASGETQNGLFTTTGHVKTFSEMHLALIVPLYRVSALAVEGGAGVSIGMIRYQLHQTSTLGDVTDADPVRARASPWISLGAAWHFTPRFSFLLRANYVNYARSAFHSSGEDVQPRFLRIEIEPMFMVRF